MTLKEQFLQIETYEEYEKMSEQFMGLDFSDIEIRKHWARLLYIPKDRMAVKDGITLAVKKKE